DRLVGHELDPGSVSAPSEIVSKSACSFDCTSTTKRALASSCSSLAFSLRSRAICASRGSAAGRRRRGGPGGPGPPAGLLGHLRIRALLPLAGHPSSIAGHQGTVEHGHGHLGKLSPSPPSGRSVVTEGRVPHDSLADIPS